MSSSLKSQSTLLKHKEPSKLTSAKMRVKDLQINTYNESDEMKGFQKAKEMKGKSEKRC